MFILTKAEIGALNEKKVKGNLYDPVNNYNYVEDTKVSVSIKKN